MSTQQQFFVLVAIPVVGILVNAALFIHLGSLMNLRFDSLESKLDHMEARFHRLIDRRR
jgi:hypothetical protein